MASGLSIPRTLEAVRPALERRLGIDARGLAAFRIALGCLLLLDLLGRAGDLRAFYTDAGVLPRAANAVLYPTLSRLSLHGLSGELWVQATLFVVTGVFAVLLVIGYRTRFVASILWLLLASLQLRNYLVLNGGDTVLLVALFVGLFLPLGERWSLDALGRESRTPRQVVVGFGTAALLSQVVSIYTTNAIFKLRGSLWMEGTAVRYVFALDRFTVRLGDFFAGIEPLLVTINWAWVGLLLVAPLLVGLVGRARTALTAAFLAAHVGMFLTMELGLFPHVMVACLLVFLPPSVWDRIERLLSGVMRQLEGRLTTVEGHPRVPLGPSLPASVRRSVHRIAPAATATILVVGLLWQAASVGYLSVPNDSPVDPEDHSWKLFAPDPPTTDGWFVVEATLESGETVDAYPHADTGLDRPPDVAATYPNARWRKYLSEVRSGSETERRAFAAYLCRSTDGPVESVTVGFVREEIRLDDPNPTEYVEFGTYDCSTVGR
ncbi:HTTM domain-containing protein [Natronomonas gomsonensis]|uniref:HTTM domain-containing protein n=1 Tax=Natronomonas gomsonensis TaxID=1046043 RepID=UPI0015B7C73C|nr:HTTM domain-containing protein [Natronomonas gomsonensis]